MPTDRSQCLDVVAAGYLAPDQVADCAGVVVAAPLLLDSALARAADATLLLVKGGLKIPEKLARSSLAWISRPFVDFAPVEP